MVGGGIDYEAELAAARLRMKLEAEAGAEGARLRREEAEEQLDGRLYVLAAVGLFYVLLDFFS